MRANIAKKNICQNKRFQLVHLRGHSEGITAIDSCSEEKVVVSGSKDKSCRVWNIKKMKAYSLEGFHINWISDVKFIDQSSGKSFISASADRSVKIWEFDNEKKNY